MPVVLRQQSELRLDGQVLRLGPAKAVAVGVRNVVWEPSGAALVFDAQDDRSNF